MNINLGNCHLYNSRFHFYMGNSPTTISGKTSILHVVIYDNGYYMSFMENEKIIPLYTAERQMKFKVTQSRKGTNLDLLDIIAK